MDAAKTVQGKGANAIYVSISTSKVFQSLTTLKITGIANIPIEKRIYTPVEKANKYCIKLGKIKRNGVKLWTNSKDI